MPSNHVECVTYDFYDSKKHLQEEPLERTEKNPEYRNSSSNLGVDPGKVKLMCSNLMQNDEVQVLKQTQYGSMGLVNLYTYIYHKNQPNVGINIPCMDPVGNPRLRCAPSAWTKWQCWHCS